MTATTEKKKLGIPARNTSIGGEELKPKRKEETSRVGQGSELQDLDIGVVVLRHFVMCAEDGKNKITLANA